MINNPLPATTPSITWPPPEVQPDYAWSTEIEIVLGTEGRPDLLRWKGLRERRTGSDEACARRTRYGLVLTDPHDVHPDAVERLGTLLARMSGGAGPIASLMTFTFHTRATA